MLMAVLLTTESLSSAQSESKFSRSSVTLQNLRFSDRTGDGLLGRRLTLNSPFLTDVFGIFWEMDVTGRPRPESVSFILILLCLLRYSTTS